jgi:phage gpG-like protein
VEKSEEKVMSKIEFKSHRNEVDKKVDNVIQQVLTEWGIVAQGYATADCPYDTGRLRASITYETDVASETTVIGTNVEYAPYVETKDKMKHPRGGKAHFMRDAVANHTSQYQNIASKYLNSI